MFPGHTNRIHNRLKMRLLFRARKKSASPFSEACGMIFETTLKRSGQLKPLCVRQSPIWVFAGLCLQLNNSGLDHS
jgi:hypothetical protein